jgi:hypothetical protein
VGGGPGLLDVWLKEEREEDMWWALKEGEWQKRTESGWLSERKCGVMVVRSGGDLCADAEKEEVVMKLLRQVWGGIEMKQWQWQVKRKSLALRLATDEAYYNFEPRVLKVEFPSQGMFWARVLEDKKVFLLSPDAKEKAFWAATVAKW